MHEMWCGTGASGEPMWHVLTADKIRTLCGVDKHEEPGGRAPTTDRHCFPCMDVFQADMASTKS
ncbi:hypothetical protein CA983_03845 [Streptomyces swartbergensis]|uniref:Uncharacterized protein n=1 Tax=Streptomyces swartbergensis TaxID=487165 RepID=A0A243SA23_9ACTN|nr:hypothetical protein CA983_03845 [Streptomyces swartbergensis]